MTPTDESRQGPAPRSEQGARRGIAPAFPLLLLETMRDMDRPEEILEDEDVTLSLPRRFGLSDVVGRHIYRLQEEVRRNRQQTVPEVEDLIRLVVRRPDAGAIFLEAGRRVAEDAWSSLGGAARHTLHWLPRPLAVLGALRAVRRLLRHLVGDARVRLHRRTLELQVTGSLTARADPGGTACAFYSGVLAVARALHAWRLPGAASALRGAGRRELRVAGGGGGVGQWAWSVERGGVRVQTGHMGNRTDRPGVTRQVDERISVRCHHPRETPRN